MPWHNFLTDKNINTLSTMKNLRTIVCMLFLLSMGMAVHAQNGNAVVSQVDIQDMGDGTGMIVVRISGNLAENYPGGTFAISGDRVSGGTAGGGIGTNTRVFIEPPVPGNGNSNGNQAVLLAGLFPIAPGTENGDDKVSVNLTLHNRFGNGLDWTYSHVGRIKRTKGL